jgi:hypothetical protein
VIVVGGAMLNVGGGPGGGVAGTVVVTLPRGVLVAVAVREQVIDRKPAQVWPVHIAPSPSTSVGSPR